MELAIGLLSGIALGVLIVGFLAVGAYNRGFEDARFRRKEFRAELVAREAVPERLRQPVRRAS